MRIAADLQIPLVEGACSTLGDVVLYDARNPATLRSALSGADILLCRSTIRVNAELLAGSNVAFVGTATSGTDHVDAEWLVSQGIHLASAAGSNACSVAEYVAIAILEEFARRGRSVQGASVGIIGAGHAGTMTARLCSALGMQVALHDPPLVEKGDPRCFVTLQEILDCDVITMHVPLTDSGEHATRNLLDESRLEQLRSDAVLVQTSRGGVIDETALKTLRSRGLLDGLVLDVYQWEPNVDADLIRCATLATPHIAGHSFDGKLRGTDHVVRALHEYLGRVDMWKSVAPDESVQQLTVEFVAGEVFENWLLGIVRSAYDIRTDAAEMLSWCKEPTGIALKFAAHRSAYQIRREFSHYSIAMDACSHRLGRVLTDLGFKSSETIGTRT